MVGRGGCRVCSLGPDFGAHLGPWSETCLFHFCLCHGPPLPPVCAGSEVADDQWSGPEGKWFRNLVTPFLEIGGFIALKGVGVGLVSDSESPAPCMCVFVYTGDGGGGGVPRAGEEGD